MKLLIVTQTVDENDPILGFFVRWIEEFAKHFESIQVIALNVGSYRLPVNVSLYSLGKNTGAGRGRRFLKYISLVWRLRGTYTHVLAHMNPEYVIVGAPFWLLSSKKTALWYNHTQKSMRLWLAARFVRIVFYTSPFAAPAAFLHAKRMPAGIDTALFKPSGNGKNQSEVYFQGRVTGAKRVHVMCEAVKKIREKGIDATLAVVGPEDPAYAKELKRTFAALISEHALVFLGPKKSSETPALYSRARVSVNLTAAGNYDKTVLESMACGTPAIVGSKAFSDMISPRWTASPEDPVLVSQKIVEMLSLPEAEYKALAGKLREAVVERHDIQVLGKNLFDAFRTL